MNTPTTQSPDTHSAEKARLEYLRGELRGERISYEELSELQSLAQHIEPSDVELLEAAGVPEFGPDDEGETIIRITPTVQVRCPAYPADCEYIAIDHDGAEVGYWHFDEWRDDPQIVMGAFLGQLKSLVG